MNDEELRSWFETLRESDRRLVPPFERMDRKRPPLRFRLVVVSLVLMIAVGVGMHSARRRPLPIEALSAWRSPTASLLDVPDSPLMTTTPVVR